MGLQGDSGGIAKCLLASKWLISFNHWQQLRNYSWFSCWCPGAAKLLPIVKGSQLFLPSANAWHQGKLPDFLMSRNAPNSFCMGWITTVSVLCELFAFWPGWELCSYTHSTSMCLLSSKQLMNSSDPSTRWDASTIISKCFWLKCEVPAQPAQYNWFPCQILLARGYGRQKCLVPVPLHQKEHKKGNDSVPQKHDT